PGRGATARVRPPPGVADPRGRQARHGDHGRPALAAQGPGTQGRTRHSAGLRGDCEVPHRAPAAQRLRGPCPRVQRPAHHLAPRPWPTPPPTLPEPAGAKKKPNLPAWFKKYPPAIPAGVCPSWPTDTADGYPGMDVRIIQKGADIPDKGFVVNVETPRED